MMNLLARFYDPTRGRILLDGVDLRDYRVDDLRRQFALVLQEPVLFSTTIGENIRYARSDATQLCARRLGKFEHDRFDGPDDTISSGCWHSQCCRRDLH